ncbi:unnamed protein product [Moneuplotes crassus]|uniref:RING-type domain-containing protein n=1 Tax=Euplotes crassus TaxID=5936 RepID=A0AAD1XS16_EUPCR|nr:unnamed protein product [Moneuplotes crassus]
MDPNNQQPGGNLAHLQNPMMPQNHAQQQVRSVSLSRKINEVETHIFGEVILLLFFSILLIAQPNHKCVMANRQQLVVFCIYLIGFKLPINGIKSYTLRRYQKESIAGLGCGVISKIFLTGWMIYSYINFFNIGDEDTCRSYWYIYLYLAYGFYVFLQACIFVCTFSIIMVFLCIYARRINRPNWNGANNQILDRLIRTRFTPANYNQNEACSVCLEEFKEEDEIITLPCNGRHIFHTHCILEWLPRNNVCPLCKEPVSVENIDRQQHVDE